MSDKLAKIINTTIDEAVVSLGPEFFLTEELGRSKVVDTLSQRTNLTEKAVDDVISAAETEVLSAICWFVKDFFKTFFK